MMLPSGMMTTASKTIELLLLGPCPVPLAVAVGRGGAGQDEDGGGGSGHVEYGEVRANRSYTQLWAQVGSRDNGTSVIYGLLDGNVLLKAEEGEEGYKCAGGDGYSGGGAGKQFK